MRRIKRFTLSQNRYNHNTFYFLCISIVCNLVLVQPVFSQNYDTKYFRSPVNFPITLAGNFGEIRPNHFHSGIDIKVPNVGIKLYASADGYVSRIRKDAGGYGNVLYITHPNGLMTVYAHLYKFNESIEKYASEIQYRNNNFEFTDYPDTTKFPIKKGEFIGFAGNSGRSYGPHLHFEIREAEKDIPINPLLFDFNIIDNIKPQIFDLIAYPLSEGSEVDGIKANKKYKLQKTGLNYTIKDVIQYSGKIGFSIHANDFMNQVSNQQGIYSLKMYVDDQLWYSHSLEKISFYDTRYINSFIDYEEKQTSGLKFQKLFTEPGNKLDIYKDLINSGIIEAKDEQIHKVKIIAKDNFNNICSLSFKIKGKQSIEKQSDKSGLLIYDADNYIIEHDFRAYIRKGSLYKNESKIYKVYSKQNGYLSNIHQLNSNLVPLHNEMHIAIKPLGLKKELIKKALIVYIDQNNEIEPLESTFMNEFIVSKCTKFGKFGILIDTVPPIITKEEKGIDKTKAISFNISDKLSGISNYYAEIDGNPIIFEYDLKNDRIVYYFDNHITYNKLHRLKLTVCDKKNNKTVIETEFFK